MANNQNNGTNGNVNPAPQQNNAGANGQQGQAQANQPTPAATEEKKGGIFERLGKQVDKAIPILSKVVIGAALLGLGYVLGNGSRGSVDTTPQIPQNIPDANAGTGATDSTNYGAF